MANAHGRICSPSKINKEAQGNKKFVCVCDTMLSCFHFLIWLLLLSLFYREL